MSRRSTKQRRAAARRRRHVNVLEWLERCRGLVAAELPDLAFTFKIDWPFVLRSRETFLRSELSLVQAPLSSSMLAALRHARDHG